MADREKQTQIDIGKVQRGQPIPLTASMNIICTHHFSSPDVAPGKLNIVLVPGMDPKLDLDSDKGPLSWLAGHAANNINNESTTDILSVCSGIYLCGAAGILKGKKACGPRGLQGDLCKRFESQEVTWLGEKLRWVGDGNLWSSGLFCPLSSFRCHVIDERDELTYNLMG